MSKKARVSVVLPHYNHGRYVAGCLDALLNQTRKPDELIVVDDASTDDSMPILEGYAEKHGIKLLKHAKNRGCAQSLFDGFAEATGDYVFMPAADDLVKPTFLERSLAELEKHPDAGFSCTLAGVIDERGIEVADYNTAVPREKATFLSPAEFFEEFEKHGSWIVSASVVFRRAAMLEAGGIPVDMGPTVDGYLVFALAGKHGLCFLPERLAQWRRLENSMSFTFSKTAKQAADLILARETLLRKTGAVPEKHLLLLRRLGYEATLDNLTRQNPFPIDGAKYLAKELPGPLGRWYRKALHHGWGYWPTKLYLFLQLPIPDQLRSIRRKLGPG